MDDSAPSLSHRRSVNRWAGSQPLRRGKACLTCRFLKIKCDGTRPICGPCQRHPKDDPCEYSDGPGRSRTRTRTRLLEETARRLEARIRELEEIRDTPPVSLYNSDSTTQSFDFNPKVTMDWSSTGYFMDTFFGARPKSLDLVNRRIKELESTLDNDRSASGALEVRKRRGKDCSAKEKPHFQHVKKSRSKGTVADVTTAKTTTVVSTTIRDPNPRPCNLLNPSCDPTPPSTSQLRVKPKFESPAQLDDMLKRMHDVHDSCNATFNSFGPPSTFTTSIGTRSSLYSDFASHAQKLRELHNSFRGLLAHTNPETKSQSQQFGKWVSLSKDIQNLLSIERQLAKSRSTRTLSQWDEFRGRSDLETAWLPASLEELQVQLCLAGIELKKKRVDPATRSSLKDMNARRKWHVGRLEIVMGLLMQGTVPPDKVEKVGRGVVHFVENNTAEDFQEERGIYDDVLIFGDEWDDGSDCYGDSPQGTDESDGEFPPENPDDESDLYSEPHDPLSSTSPEREDTTDAAVLNDLSINHPTANADGPNSQYTNDGTEAKFSLPQSSSPTIPIPHNDSGIRGSSTSISCNQIHNNNGTTTDTTNSHNTNTKTNTHSHNVYITNHHHHHHHRSRQERRKSRWSVTKFVYHHLYVPMFWNPYGCFCSFYQAGALSGFHGWLAWVMAPFNWHLP